MKTCKSVLLLATFLLYSASAAAQLSFHDQMTNQGVLDQVISEFSIRAAAWQTVVMRAASWLFWTLGTISFTWTMGMLALKKADIGEFLLNSSASPCFLDFSTGCFKTARISPTPSFVHCARLAMKQPEQQVFHRPELSISAS
jgi:hypothetical protein